MKVTPRLIALAALAAILVTACLARGT